MRDVFIADAHLRSPDDANYRRLLDFLAAQQGRIRTLVLLGDIFEFWVGFRHVVYTPYVPILDALRRLREAGTEIVYVEGNHDFHLGPYFRDTLGCRIFPDGGGIDLDGRHIHIAHGDLIDGNDRGYRLLRRVFRSRALHLLMNIVPPDLTWAVAAWAGRRSQQRRAGRPARRVPRDMLLNYAQRHFAEGATAVVSGHFHEPLLVPGEEGTLVALGDWITQYSYAVLENGAFTLHTF